MGQRISTPAQLRQAISQGLPPLTWVSGDELLLVIEAADLVRARARKLGFEEREVLDVDARFDRSRLIEATQSTSLFASQRLIDLRLNTKPTRELGDALRELLPRLDEGTRVLVSSAHLERATTSTAWFEALAKQMLWVETPRIDAGAMGKWVTERLAAQKQQATPAVLALITERTEGNLLAAKQEIDKLVLLHPQGHTVNMADAEAAVANVARFDVFQLAGAWMKGDGLRVARLLEGLEESGEEPVLLLWAVAEDIRTLIRLTAALKQGQNVQSLRNSLRLWGDKQTLAPMAAGRLHIGRLLAALQTCAKIDRIIKGAEDGNAWSEFKRLVIGLAA